MRVGSPVVTSIEPVTFSAASSTMKILFGQPPMLSVSLPPISFGGAAAKDRAAAAASAAPANSRFSMASSREHEVQLPPVLLRRCALRRPVGRVIQLIGHLRRPEEADVAVEDVALDGLAEAGSAAVRVGFPAR